MMAWAKRELEDLVNFCKGTPWNGKTLADNPLVRHRLAQLAIEIETGRALSYRIAWLQEKGEFLRSTYAASAAKVYGTELGQRLINAAIEILGPYAQMKKGSRWTRLNGTYETGYQLCPGSNIAAGSSEIQRNLIAWVGLGLPRS
ncbi:acyl-CoA dehydrogenase family protein [Chloroflexota bacterium]